MDAIHHPHDPRLGDEPPERDRDVEALSDGHADRRQRPRKHVHMDIDEDEPSRMSSHTTSHTSPALNEKSSKPILDVKIPHIHIPHDKPSFHVSSLVDSLPFDFAWIPANFTWSKLKPVIRCALVAWISIVFVVIGRTEQVLGQVSR